MGISKSKEVESQPSLTAAVSTNPSTAATVSTNPTAADFTNNPLAETSSKVSSKSSSKEWVHLEL